MPYGPCLIHPSQLLASLNTILCKRLCAKTFDVSMISNSLLSLTIGGGEQISTWYQSLVFFFVFETHCKFCHLKKCARGIPETTVRILMRVTYTQVKLGLAGFGSTKFLKSNFDILLAFAIGLESGNLTLGQSVPLRGISALRKRFPGCFVNVR